MLKRIKLSNKFLSSFSEAGVENIEIVGDVPGATEFWKMFLAMAVRDSADFLDYLPMRGGHAVNYVVRGTRYTLVPPPPEWSSLMLAAARELLTPRGIWPSIRRWIGAPVTGQLRLDCEYGESHWAGVVWSAGNVSGADFYRLDLQNLRPVFEEASPASESEQV